MRKRIALFVGLLLASCAIPAFAQNLRQLPRATATGGVNDSALVLVSDSASRTRAISGVEFKRFLSRGTVFDSLRTGLARFTDLTVTGTCTGCGGVSDPLRLGNGTAAAPTYSFTNSTGTGLYRFGADTLGFATGGVHSLRLSGGASATLAGGAGNMTILAGTGASRTLTLQTTTSGSVAKNTLVLGADSSATFLGSVRGMRGSAEAPGISFGDNTNSGLYHDGIATRVYLSVGGSEIVRWVNNAGTLSASVVAGADGAQSSPQFTIGLFGGGWKGLYSRSDSLVLISKGVGFVKGFSDTLIINSRAKAPALTAAAGTPNSVCMNATTKEVVENAATSCVVSSARFKSNIAPLSPTTATRTVARLKPSTFTYRTGGKEAIGLIAEETAIADSRLVTHDAQGRINAVNYEQVTVLLLATVQQQQKDLAALKTRRAGFDGLTMIGLGVFALGFGIGAGTYRRRREGQTTA